MLDRDLELVGQRSPQVRIDDVGGSERIGIVVVEAAEVLDEGAELARIHVVVAVLVVPHVFRAAEAAAAGRVVPGDDASAELVRVTRVRGTQQRVLLGAERVIDSHPGLERLPLELDRAAVVVQSRDEVGKGRVGRDPGSRIVAPLHVVAESGVDREVTGSHRVADEAVVILVLVGDDRRPEDVGDGAAARADSRPGRCDSRTPP